MLKPLLSILPVLIFTACAGKGDQDVNLQEKLKKDTTTSAQQIIFAEPQIIDSSHIVIYPLILEKETYGGSAYKSNSRGQRTAYWNLVFYNTETGEQALLTLDKKILIHSINFQSSSSSSSAPVDWTNGISVFKSNIIYTVVSKDHNANKQLDEEDAGYLYASDREGKNFRQVSPDDYNILSWDIVKGTTKIIMQGQKDSNGDKKFDDHDPVIPLVVDLNSSQPAEVTFKPGFTDSLKQRLVMIWKKQ